MRRHNRAAELGPQQLEWWKDWRGECVAIVASGPSAKTANLALLRNRIHVIAINESIDLCPWADILYGCDGAWWKLRGFNKNFGGLKVTQDIAVVGQCDLKKIDVDPSGNELIVDEPGKISGGGNSGFQALNLAIQFGVNGVLLAGYDMSAENGAHWHGRHPPGLNNPVESSLERWRVTLDAAARDLQDLGCEVINCSLYSALEAYPKMTIEQALVEWKL